MAQDRDSGLSCRVPKPPIPPPGTPPGPPGGVVPVAPLGRGQEPAGARVQDGQVSQDGRYVWDYGAWVPRPLRLAGDAAQLGHLSAAHRYLRRSEPAAELGFRGFLHRRLGIRVRPSSEERSQRHLMEAARTAAHGPQLIAVASWKGGVGKSTLAMLLGSQFSAARRDRALVLDCNPGSGSLAIRCAHHSPVGATDIAPYAAGVESYEQLQQYVTVMAQTGLEVLPSLPDREDSPDGVAAPEISQMARRFFAVMLADLGTGVAASGWWLENADQVVVVATPSLDGALLAQSTLAQLARWRGTNWVRENAIVVMNQAGLADPHIRVDAQERDLRSEVRQVFRMSWDPHLAVGGPIDWHELGPQVRQEILRIAADLGAKFTREGDSP